MSSNVSSPLLEPTTSQQLPQPSPSPLAATRNQPNAQAPDSDVPPLSLEVLTKREDKVAALKLVADSIAQQRQVASLHLVFHPLLFGVLALALGITYRYTWAGPRQRHDLGLTLSLMSGVTMAYLAAIRMWTSGYLNVAEGMSWDFLLKDVASENPDATNAANGNNEDIVLGARFGTEVIGALVLRLEPSPSANGSGRGRKNGHHRGNSLYKGGKGVIRAWTTRLRYRGKGVGGDLLHEAVRITREKCGKDAAVGFAKEHANSTMVLPEWFNRPFRKQEVRAAKALEGVLGEWEVGKRKR